MGNFRNILNVYPFRIGHNSITVIYIVEQYVTIKKNVKDSCVLKEDGQNIFCWKVQTYNV